MANKSASLNEKCAQCNGTGYREWEDCCGHFVGGLAPRCCGIPAKCDGFCVCKAGQKLARNVAAGLAENHPDA